MKIKNTEIVNKYLVFENIFIFAPERNKHLKGFERREPELRKFQFWKHLVFLLKFCIPLKTQMKSMHLFQI